jgi:hypothetical protein
MLWTLPKIRAFAVAIDLKANHARTNVSNSTSA